MLESKEAETTEQLVVTEIEIMMEVAAMAREDNRSVHMIHADGKLGEVQIADEVVAIIAGLAATEVEGVASMAGNITNELISRLGMKNLSKGVKVLVTDRNVDVDLALNIEYGYSIMKVSEKVQDKVKAAIEIGRAHV